jgi:Transposase
MGKPYSDDLRERVVAAIEAGHTRVKVAELYNMALSTVGGFIKRKRETGSVRGGPLPATKFSGSPYSSQQALPLQPLSDIGLEVLANRGVGSYRNQLANDRTARRSRVLPRPCPCWSVLSPMPSSCGGIVR